MAARLANVFVFFSDETDQLFQLLENLLTDLKVKLSLKEEEVDHLKRTNEEKDKLLLELKGKWTECASVWNQKLKNYQSELENQRKDKLEIQEVRNSFTEFV